MAERFNVFLSSTAVDLPDYRARVRDAILRLGMYPLLMEAFNASDQNSVQLVYDTIQKADIFIGLYAHRYGYVPSPGLRYANYNGEIHTTDGTKSISQLEYEWARERQIPLLLYLMADDHPWPINFIEQGEGGKRLDLFKRSLASQHVVQFFTTPDHLAYNVSSALGQFLSSPNQQRSKQNETQNEPSEECIPNFDERVFASVLKAMEVTNAYRNVDDTSNIVQDDPSVLRVQPIFITPPSRLPQYLCDVFVIMPFADSFTAVYTDVIKPTCEQEFNLTVKRGDDFSTDSYIMEEIWNGMNSSKIVIADCTGKNPNVFYELGIAHTLGKRTVLISQSVGDVPFDVAGRRFIQYEDRLSGQRRLRNDLKARITAILSEINRDS